MKNQPKLFEPEVPIPEELKPAVDLWLQHKAERRERYKPTGLRLLLDYMVEMGPERALAAVKHSIASNYSGLYEASYNYREKRKPAYDPVADGGILPVHMRGRR